MMKRWICLGLACLALTACKPDEKKAIELGKKQVADLMKDPESAKFRDVIFRLDKDDGDLVSGYVCGQINGKNAYGAYGGYSPFYVYLTMTSKGVFSRGVTYTVEANRIIPEPDASLVKLYKTNCGVDLF